MNSAGPTFVGVPFFDAFAKLARGHFPKQLGFLRFRQVEDFDPASLIRSSADNCRLRFLAIALDQSSNLINSADSSKALQSPRESLLARRLCAATAIARKRPASFAVRHYRLRGRCRPPVLATALFFRILAQVIKRRVTDRPARPFAPEAANSPTSAVRRVMASSRFVKSVSLRLNADSSFTISSTTFVADN